MRFGALVFTSVVWVGLSACTGEDNSSIATGGRVSPTYTGPAEASYCSTSITHSSPVTVTGTAQYKRRTVSTSGLGSAASATTHPIRLAEVRVTDPAGNVVQCGETDASGAFSITLPQGNVDYTVSVNSRAYNSSYRVSVLNMPEANQFYSLSVTVNPSAAGPINAGVLTAAANGDTLGAAFNILDQVYEATAYLRSKVSTCSTAIASNTSCVNVSTSNPIAKVSIYWEKGYNPNAYFGSTSGLSFYLPGYSRIFILGGVNGDTDNTDTDHYDNSVIIHEYGHFLEDVVFASDSPGGSHSGNAVIDPRLAWSEGWGNFFQARVLGSAFYRDSIGNADGSTALAFNVDIEDSAASTNAKDIPASAGEGNFREFAVSRLLWDATDNTPVENINPGTALDDINDEFLYIWSALTKNDRGFRDSDYAFRNVGHLHLSQVWMDANAGGSDWSNIRTGNRHDANTSEYAEYVEFTGAACSDFVIDPQAGDTSTSVSGSHLFRNNDFYHIKITSAGSYTIQLTYDDADGAGTEADLDLFVYNESARFASSSDMVGYSRLDPDSQTNITLANPATQETESVTATLQPGVYLINVQAYTGGGSATYTAAGNTNYRIRVNGNLQCPVNLAQ
jgi:hypothetical protein